MLLNSVKKVECECHEHIVHYIDSFEDDKKLWIVINAPIFDKIRPAVSMGFSLSIKGRLRIVLFGKWLSLKYVHVKYAHTEG